MNAWEYKTLTINNVREADPILNREGKDGWELVSVSGLAPNLFVAFLKRPKAWGT